MNGKFQKIRFTGETKRWKEYYLKPQQHYSRIIVLFITSANTNFLSKILVRDKHTRLIHATNVWGLHSSFLHQAKTQSLWYIAGFDLITCAMYLGSRAPDPFSRVSCQGTFLTTEVENDAKKSIILNRDHLFRCLWRRITENAFSNRSRVPTGWYKRCPTKLDAGIGKP